MDTMTPPTPRGRGRPVRGQGLTEGAILDAAFALLDTHGAAFSMRALARSLGVDVMALYHYFPTKQALVDAVVLAAFSPLDDTAPPFDATHDVGARLEALAALYLGTVRRHPALTRELAAGRLPEATAAARFDALFARAVEPLNLTETEARLASHALVDYVHGFALGGEGAGDAWRFGVRLLSLGLQQLRPLPAGVDREPRDTGGP